MKSKVLIVLLGQIISLITPQIRALICSALKDVLKKAEATDNPFDDLIINLVIKVLECKE